MNTELIHSFLYFFLTIHFYDVTTNAEQDLPFSVFMNLVTTRLIRCLERYHKNARPLYLQDNKYKRSTFRHHNFDWGSNKGSQCHSHTGWYLSNYTQIKNVFSLYKDGQQMQKQRHISGIFGPLLCPDSHFVNTNFSCFLLNSVKLALASQNSVKCE